MIKLFVSGASCRVSKTPDEKIVATTVGKTVQIDYGPDWLWTQELSPTAVTVVVSDGTVTKDVINVGSSFTIPWECMQTAGRDLRISIQGETGSNAVTKRTPTVIAELGQIVAPLSPSGDTSYTPSATVIEQLTSAIQGKQATLVSGTNIKTINSTSLLGSGDIEVGTWGTITGTLADQTDLSTALAGKAASSHTHETSDVTGLDTALAAKQDTISDLSTIRSGAEAGATALQSVPDTYRTSAAQDEIDAGKQATLVSGTNIKTINNINILGSGNIEIQGGGGTTPTWGNIGGTLNDQTDLKEALDEKADTDDIPTKTSDLTNDSNFLTEHQSLSGYATESWVEDKGYLTQHQSLSAYRTSSAQDIIDSGKEDTTNKVTAVSSSSTDTQYPSAKCVYDELEEKADETDLTATQGMISDAWSSSYAPYDVGSYAIYDNKLWRCLVANSVAPSEGSNWTEVSVADEVKTLNSKTLKDYLCYESIANGSSCSFNAPNSCCGLIVLVSASSHKALYAFGTSSSGNVTANAIVSDSGYAISTDTNLITVTNSSGYALRTSFFVTHGSDVTTVE